MSVAGAAEARARSSTMSAAVMRACSAVAPRWIMPAGIGLAMLGFTVWNEYSWYSRVTDQLPASVEVATGSEPGT